jgi:hypothetical protein
MNAMLILLGIAGAVGFVILCFRVSELGMKRYGLDPIFSWPFLLVLISLSSVVTLNVVTAEDHIMAAQTAAAASVIGAAFLNVWKSTLWFGILLTIVQVAVLTSVVLVFFIWADSRSATGARSKPGTW